MIYIIGTRHSLQVWTDAVRKGESLDASPQEVAAFESYLLNSTQSLNAGIIAEEASEESVAAYVGGSSVAKGVAAQLGIKHLFCDPDTAQRRSIGKVGEELDAAREAVWLEHLEGCDPNNRSVIFVCGAKHVDTFKDRLDSKQILAEIHCADWTEGTKG